MKKYVLISSLILGLSFETYAATSGSCGEGCSFVINDDGHMVINGMSNATTSYNGPFFPALDLSVIHSVTSVSFNENETNISIPDKAFHYFSNLGSVDLSNVTSIGASAFRDTNLEKVDLSNVTSIGASAFRDTNLEKVDLSNVQLLEGSLIFAFTPIKEAILPNTLTKIPPEIFYSTNLEKITLPDTLKEIGSNAFMDTNLKEIVIPEGVEKIWNQAFLGTDLTEVTLPSTLKLLGADVFRGTNITDLVIPNSTVEIMPNAFFCPPEEECPLKSITVPDDLKLDISMFNHAISDTISMNKWAQESGDEWMMEEMEWRIQFAKEEFATLSNIQIVCQGDIEKCKSNFSWTEEYQELFGNMPIQIISSEDVGQKKVKNADGSITIYDADNNIIGYKNKRIYTVEEASRLSKPTGNTFKLRYK
ncbi:MAG: leucine-rich repeat domain-containing protein [Alphaproteobacteria bacterium]|nr:leucine-rich repeat domain-containing protein [Alphaproteobacteria bacterium]